MLFRTESGSLYEVDETGHRIRRISNAVGMQATERQGDGAWKEYTLLSDIKPGFAVMIVWKPSDTPLLEGSPADALPTTITNLVAEVIQ